MPETTQAHVQAGIAARRRASDISLTIKGQKQGDFKGGTKKKGRANQIDVWDTNYRAVSPRDLSTGQATGRRQHNPLVVYSEVEGGAPIQIWNALINNELLPKILLDFWRSNEKDGKQAIYYTVELKDSVVSEFEMFCDEDGRPNCRTAFTFKEITMTWKDGNITGTDTWHGTT